MLFLMILVTYKILYEEFYELSHKQKYKIFSVHHNPISISSIEMTWKKKERDDMQLESHYIVEVRMWNLPSIEMRPGLIIH